MRLQVEVNCPQCGGLTLFPEDSYVFKCRFCSSSLHVTGCNEILSYCFPVDYTRLQISMKIKRAARAMGFDTGRMSLPQLVYIPFWRVRAMVFNWVFWGVDSFGADSRTSDRSRPDKELRATSLDLTFLATDSFDPGLDTLGIRTRTISVKLFESKLFENTVTLPVTIPDSAALQKVKRVVKEKVFRIKTEHLLHSLHIVNRVLSVVYFPFYMVLVDSEEGKNTIVLDAVAERICRTIPEATPIDLFGNPVQPQKGIETNTMGFLAFRCPVCGWDLPFLPYSRIHICGICYRAWQERKSRFTEIDYDLVVPQKESDKRPVFMPFWRLEVNIRVGDDVAHNLGEFRRLILGTLYQGPSNPDRPIYFYVPAFRVKSVAASNKVATDITRLQPELELSDERDFPGARFVGAFAGEKDAEEMSRVLQLSLVRASTDGITTAETSEIKVLSARLTYLPFYEERLYLREPVTGATVHKSAGT